jgi:hypothetical protein
VNQVVIVFLTATALSDVFVFLFRRRGHRVILFQKEASKAGQEPVYQVAEFVKQTHCLGRRRIKKADVVEHPKVFRHIGLLRNAPPECDRAALYQVVRKGEGSRHS